jgi:hypothetical protein
MNVYFSFTFGNFLLCSLFSYTYTYVFDIYCFSQYIFPFYNIPITRSLLFVFTHRCPRTRESGLNGVFLSRNGGEKDSEKYSGCNSFLRLYDTMLNFVENLLENDRSLVLIEGLSHFLTNFLQNLASCQTSFSYEFFKLTNSVRAVFTVTRKLSSFPQLLSKEQYV